MFLHLSAILLTGGHTWQGRVWWDMHGRGHLWQERCVWQGGMHGKGDMCGRGVCVQEKRPLKRAIRILLECILVYFSAYTQFDNCLGTSLDGCQKLVLAIFEGMDNLFDHICGPGKEGIFISYQSKGYFRKYDQESDSLQNH